MTTLSDIIANAVIYGFLGVQGLTDEQKASFKKDFTYVDEKVLTKPNYEQYFEYYGNMYNIDPKVLKAIARAESGINHKAIGFSTTEDFFNAKLDKKFPCKMDKNVGSLKRMVSCFPETAKDAVKLFYTLQKSKQHLSTIDYGIMQINERTAKTNGVNELLTYLYPNVNIHLGAKTLRMCIDKFAPEQSSVIECYNKGFKKSNFTGNYYYAVLKKL